MRRIVHLSVFALAAVVLRPESARACSPPVCAPVVAKPASGVLPENRTGLLVDRVYEAFDYELHRKNGESTEAVDATVTDIDSRTVLITPTTPWAEGEEYVLFASSCGVEPTESPLPERARFTIGPSAALPTSLGTTEVAVNEENTLWVIGGPACTEEMPAASAEVTLTPSASAEAWQGALVFEVLVDGTPFGDGTRSSLSGADVTGPSATVYRLCDVDGVNTLAEGTHEVQFRATLPGTELSLTSAPADVELHCDGNTGAAGAAGASTGGGSNTGGTSNSGGTRNSGGVGSGGYPDDPLLPVIGGSPSGGQGQLDSANDSSDDGGCSVTAAPGATSGVPWLLAALGALASGRRVRRRDSRKSR